MSVDDLTGILSNALRILTIQNPKKTAMGALGGFVVSLAIEVIFRFSNSIYPDFIASWKFSIVGIFIIHFPSMFGNGEIPEEIEQQLRVVEEIGKRARFSKIEQKQMYRKIITNYIDNTSNKNSNTQVAINRPSA